MTRAVVMCAAALVTLVVITCHVSAFSINRKASPASDLSPALKLLERHKRHIPDGDYLYSPRSRGQLSRFDAWDRDEPNANERLFVKAFGEMPQYRDDYNQNNVDSSSFENSVKAVQPSKEEIENIFSDEQEHDNDFNSNIMKKSQSLSYDGESNLKEKKSKEILNPLAPLPPKMKKSVSEDDVKVSLDNLTKEELEVLMNVVQKLKQQTSESETASTADDSDTSVKSEALTVTDKELTQMFEDMPPVTEETKTVVAFKDGRPVAEESTTREKEEIPSDLTDQEADNFEEEEEIANQNSLSPEDQYWLLNNYLSMSDTRKKRAPIKRSYDPAALEQTYLSEIDRLQKKVETLKLIAQLEDIENDALTKSLNEATLSQREGTVSEKEFAGLKEAISVEEALQAIKTGAISPEDLSEMVASSESKRGEPLYKKARKKMDPGSMEDSYPEYTRKRRKWYEEPEPESISTRKRNFLEAQRSVDEMVNDFTTGLDQSAKESEDEEENEYPEASVSTDRSNGPNYLLGLNYASNPTETAVELYPTKQRQDGECPAVERLISDCQFADDYGLPIDEEARGLCNRHELCYACGGTKELAPGQCDNFYRADAALLCDKDEDCVLQAELFLRTLKLKHRYNQYTEALCRDDCVNDVLGIMF
ncbi:uncharacterized protein LOC121373956 [Gigantopelta aegis]|uniref:uncharacterized protein LOC121373956 n=1 Tax=Gigantopelta aegis TaxID=1735272 RepID=UPI001B889B94|nr:uncharacterized protein LOC121373956 [Gigantopelta aegis]